MGPSLMACGVRGVNLTEFVRCVEDVYYGLVRIIPWYHSLQHGPVQSELYYSRKYPYLLSTRSCGPRSTVPYCTIGFPVQAPSLLSIPDPIACLLPSIREPLFPSFSPLPACSPLFLSLTLSLPLSLTFSLTISCMVMTSPAEYCGVDRAITLYRREGVLC